MANSSGTVCLISGFCTSARTFAPRFFQTPPHGDALALRYDFTSIRLSRGLSPPSCRTCSAHENSPRRKPWENIGSSSLAPERGVRPAWRRSRASTCASCSSPTKPRPTDSSAGGMLSDYMFVRLHSFLCRVLPESSRPGAYQLQNPGVVKTEDQREKGTGGVKVRWH